MYTPSVARSALLALSPMLCNNCSSPAAPADSPNAIQAPAPLLTSAELQRDATESPEASDAATSALNPSAGNVQATSPLLVVEPMRLLTSTGDILILKADGTLLRKAKGKTRFLGNVTSAGELVGPGGKHLVVLSEGGRLTRGDGSELPIRLLDDGTAKSPEQTLWFNDSGYLEGSAAAAPTVHAEGMTKFSRRTAMFLLILAAFPVGH